MGGICPKCKGTIINYKHSYEYDLIVIGGGSGGIAAAKEAAQASQKVLLCNYVVPSPLGSVWGLGGTCTNVGCVPKKLMHTASLVGDYMRTAPAFGYTSVKSILNQPKTTLMSGEFEHDWTQLIEDVQDHVKSLSWKLRLTCNKYNIEYVNAFATFMGDHTIKTMTKDDREQVTTGNHFLIATGGRPKYLDIPGGRKEDALCITSDDIFALKYPPGKVLIVGASYIALECAGFLVSLNYEVTVAVRSVLLSKFDQEMANKVRLHLQSVGVLFRLQFQPTLITKLEDGAPPKFEVTLKNLSKDQESMGGIPEIVEVYNTVLLAIGREPTTEPLNLHSVSVKIADSGKISVNDSDQTTAKYIYAVGDCAEGRPELTPSAIKAGKLLAQRLYRGSKVLMDYVNIPTTIYTPIEYGCIGLAEEDALGKHGQSNVVVYQTLFQPIEYALPHIYPTTCFLKLICLKNRKEQVVGLHYFGPNAGEVTQGWAIAFKFKATKADFDSVVGIHPTCAERFTTLYIRKGDDIDVEENC